VGEMRKTVKNLLSQEIILNVVSFDLFLLCGTTCPASFSKILVLDCSAKLSALLH